MSSKQDQSQQSEKESSQVKKDSTVALPMFDLQEAIAFVLKIHEEALETAAMPGVAKGTGYSTPTSTPFYRRIVAARLFGLISSTGAALTTRAKDYFKPDSEDAKAKALVNAVNGIPHYAELVEKNAGKRLNVELIANGIEKTFNLTSVCSSICAKAFAESIKFAGMLASDGTVSLTGPKLESQPKPNGSDETQPAQQEAATPDIQKHTLYLSKDKARKLEISGPIEITRAEYDRICKWIEVALMVADNPEKKEVSQ